jgi:hypothetical protein
MPSADRRTMMNANPQAAADQARAAYRDMTAVT